MELRSVNKAILIGHIGAKPEGRYTQDGVSTASFSIATNESWVDNDKNKREKTEWHNIVVWNKLADFSTEYLEKGQMVYIEGAIRSRTWVDTKEQKRKITEIYANKIVPLEWKKNEK